MTTEEMAEGSAPLADLGNSRKNTLTLVHVFQIVTGCALFFACMRLSPVLAIALTVLFTPAIIRTGVITNQLRANGVSFGFRKRIEIFFASMGVNLMTLVTCFAAFLFVSVSFGLFCVVFAFATMRTSDLLADVGFIGTLGGTIWGSAAALLSLTWTQRLWRISLDDESGT